MTYVPHPPLRPGRNASRTVRLCGFPRRDGDADLELYRAAQAEMRSLLGEAKLPKMDVLKEEGRPLQGQVLFVPAQNVLSG